MLLERTISCLAFGPTDSESCFISLHSEGPILVCHLPLDCADPDSRYVMEEQYCIVRNWRLACMVQYFLDCGVHMNTDDYFGITPVFNAVDL